MWGMGQSRGEGLVGAGEGGVGQRWRGSEGEGAKVGGEGLVGADEGGTGQGWVGSVGEGAKVGGEGLVGTGEGGVGQRWSGVRLGGAGNREGQVEL